MSDHAALINLARQRAERAWRVSTRSARPPPSGASSRPSTTPTAPVAPATDEELAAVTRALIGDLR